MKSYDVLSLIGENCITLSDGQALYERIFPELARGQAVVLDFAGVKIFASPFFNTAIGQLLKDFSSDTVNELLVISHLIPYAQNILVRVIANARRYYSDLGYRNAVDEVIAGLSKEQ